jgi:hypothetical protein
MARVIAPLSGRGGGVTHVDPISDRLMAGVRPAQQVIGRGDFKLNSHLHLLLLCIHISRNTTIIVQELGDLQYGMPSVKKLDWDWIDRG